MNARHQEGIDKLEVYGELQNASATLDEGEMSVWLFRNIKRLRKANINIHPSRVSFGEKLLKKFPERYKLSYLNGLLSHEAD